MLLINNALPPYVVSSWAILGQILEQYMWDLITFFLLSFCINLHVFLFIHLFIGLCIVNLFTFYLIYLFIFLWKIAMYYFAVSVEN